LSRFSAFGDGAATARAARAARPKEYIIMRARLASIEDDEMWRIKKVILEY
jgi:hypothetical protein